MDIFETILAGRSDSQLACSYLFHGPKKSNKRALARRLGEKLLGTKSLETHPDYIGLSREEHTSSITIDTVREFNRQIHLTRLVGSNKVAIIWDARTLNKASANSLLKVLEEPPECVTIILICDTPFSLPDTILSRCSMYKFYAIGKSQQISISEEVSKLLRAPLYEQFSIIRLLVEKLKKQPEMRAYEIGEHIIILADEIESLLQRVMYVQSGQALESINDVDALARDISKIYSSKAISSMLLSLGNLRYTIAMKGNAQLAFENYILQSRV